MCKVNFLNQTPQKLDEQDPLAQFRNSFYIPKSPHTNKECIYLAGHSLGLQPKKAKKYIEQELEDWAMWGVEGHFHAQNPWVSYHELVTQPLANLLGAKPIEVVAMNTLTVNLHLMLVSFYQPTLVRHKILFEENIFSSDLYALSSQAQLHGYDTNAALLKLRPRPSETCLHTEDILEVIEKNGSSIATVLLGQVNYFTGQGFDIPAIVQAAHKKGCMVGLDLAHGIGNLAFKLHDWDVDFAVWCNYKYLNSGPGGLGGCFIHERYADKKNHHRLAGWWGHNKQARFKMEKEFDPIVGAEGWQISNPPIFQLAALRASLELFEKATIDALREKSIKLTGYLEHLLKKQNLRIITPNDFQSRGAQLSVQVSQDPQELVKKLNSKGVVCDYRHPNILRITPCPLYNSFEDVYQFSEILKGI